MFHAVKRPNVAILASSHQHCLKTLLEANLDNRLCNIKVIISNDASCRELANAFNVEFKYFSVTAHNQQNIEGLQIFLLQSLDIDLVILAQYTPILSPVFHSVFAGRLITTFSTGSTPFECSVLQSAQDRGEEVRGVCATYTKDGIKHHEIILHDGFIVDIKKTPDQIQKSYFELEADVLLKAVTWHLQGRILRENGECYVLDSPANVISFPVKSKLPTYKAEQDSAAG